ncbi:MAG: Two-component transcriptional response regulator, LuxR family, partial [uncultured Pseudonocardia sp.]
GRSADRGRPGAGAPGAARAARERGRVHRGRRGGGRPRGRRRGGAHAPGRGAHGRPDAGDRRPRGHPADHRPPRAGRHPRGGADHVRARRVRLRGSARRRQRLPAQGHRAGAAARGDPHRRRRWCPARPVGDPHPDPGVRRPLAALACTAPPAAAADRARAGGRGAGRAGDGQRRDRRSPGDQPGHRAHPRQPVDGQARRPRPCAARRLRVPVGPGL